ncbi:MAG: DNA gyrase inhibitor YacG [Polyangiales bacterium]
MVRPCPICKRDAEADRSQNEFAPFCSKRCRVIDLGRWLDESYRIPAVEDDGDEESPPESNATSARGQ